jgi:hypothetical protein
MRFLTAAVVSPLLLLLIFPATAVACPWDLRCTIGRYKDERVRCAKNLRTYFSKIDKAVPALSPAEEAWLRKELKSDNPRPRRERAMETTEYARSSVKKELSDAIPRLDRVIAGEGREAAQWIIFLMAINNIDYKYSLATLIERQVLEIKDLDLGTTSRAKAREFLDAGCMEMTRTILAFMILPIIQDYPKRDLFE